MTNNVYLEMCKQTHELGPIIDRILSTRIGAANFISKKDLAFEVFGNPLPKQYQTAERQIRDVISDLVTFYERDFVSGNNEGGYGTSAIAEEVEANINDISSRIQKLEARREALYRILAKKYGVIRKEMKSQAPLFDAETMSKLKQGSLFFMDAMDSSVR